MIKPVISFSIKLIVILSVVFCIHIGILSYLNFPLLENRIIFSYIINAILAFAIYATLFKLRIKYLDILGFIFMGGSFLKFGTYFILFYPFYKQNGDVDGLEATSFLIPYIVCLFFETFYLIKLLNNKL